MLSLLVYLFLVHTWNRKFSGICYVWLLSQDSSSRSRLYSFWNFLLLCHRVSACNFVHFLTLQLSVIHIAATWEGWSCCLSSSAPSMQLDLLVQVNVGVQLVLISYEIKCFSFLHDIAFVVMLVVLLCVNVIILDLCCLTFSVGISPLCWDLLFVSTFYLFVFQYWS